MVNMVSPDHEVLDDPDYKIAMRELNTYYPGLGAHTPTVKHPSPHIGLQSPNNIRHYIISIILPVFIISVVSLGLSFLCRVWLGGSLPILFFWASSSIMAVVVIVFYFKIRRILIK